MKASIEEQKVYESSKDTHRILKGMTQNKNLNKKFCNICQRNNHFTNQCRYGNRGTDTGQPNSQSFNNKSKEIKKNYVHILQETWSLKRRVLQKKKRRFA